MKGKRENRIWEYWRGVRKTLCERKYLIPKTKNKKGVGGGGKKKKERIKWPRIQTGKGNCENRVKMSWLSNTSKIQTSIPASFRRQHFHHGGHLSAVFNKFCFAFLPSPIQRKKNSCIFPKARLDIKYMHFFLSILHTLMCLRKELSLWLSWT